jgi:hypothetical protein
MIKKGRRKIPSDFARLPRGESHYAAKLSTSQVESLRADRKAGLSFRCLGLKYGIRGETAFKIAKGYRRKSG